MKVYKTSACLFFPLIAVLTLVRCTESGSSFLDFYKVETSLPLSSQEIASPYKHQPIVAYINDRYEIYGVGNGSRFYTEDFFETVHHTSGFGSFGDFTTDGKYVLASKYDDNTVFISESSDYGFHFKEKLAIPGIYWEYDYKLFHLDASNGWLAKRQGTSLIFYRITGKSFSVVGTLSTPNNANDVVALYFKNLSEGWVMVDGDFAGNVKVIYKTTDGGATWGPGVKLNIQKDSGNTPYDVTTIRGFNNLLLCYNKETYRNDFIYISNDGGSTWTFLRNGMRSFQFFDDQVGLAVKTLNYAYNWEDEKLASTGHLYKTANGGKTWEKVSDQVLYADRIFFLNEHMGLAMSYSVVQITTNGGATWNLLVYPLEEADD